MLGTVNTSLSMDAETYERSLIKYRLGAKFSVNANPSPAGFGGMNFGRAGLYYYLYGVERVGRLTGRRFLAKHDWYREGAEMLVRQQDKLSGFWRATAAARTTN